MSYPRVIAVNVNVYDFPLGECTNGISSLFKSLTLFREDATEQEIYSYIERNKIAIDKCLICDSYKDYVRCRPLSQPKHRGMAGGNFVYTSDSRYKIITGVQYPISVHDRVEN